MSEPSLAVEVEISTPDRDVSGLWLRPADATSLLVMAHGAGAGMRHPYMRTMASLLAERRIATLRYQFPYMEAGSKRPDSPPKLIATVRAAVETATRIGQGLRLYAGGKSMGGRMTSLAASDSPLPGVEGLVFFGFPLHASGRPGTERAEHLGRVELPMLFLQGSRDRLAELGLLRGVCDRLGARASLNVVEDADHSFHVPKRSGRTDAEVLEDLAQVVAEWMRALDRGVARAALA